MDYDILLQPIMIKFKEDCAKVEQRITDKEKEVEKQLIIQGKLNKELQAEIREVSKAAKSYQERLTKEIDKYKDLQSQIQKEVSETIRINKEIELNIKKTQDALDNAKAEMDLAVLRRKEGEEIILKYERKSASLNADFISLDEKTKELAIKQRSLKAQEKDLIRKQEKIDEDNRSLSIREINHKAKQQNLEIEIKRSKLNA